jgi:hypothetical protein
VFVEIDKKSMRKRFPNLIKELETGESKVPIDSVQPVSESDTMVGVSKKTTEKACRPDKFRGYNPTVFDFIRRCDTNPQVEEIITYLHKKGELTAKDAAEIRDQLKRDGLRSFGCKKEEDYYFKHGSN